MKTTLLLLFLFLVNSVSADSFVPYAPDSLKKGDWLTIESVHFYPYVAPGIREELPWRPENIRKVIFRATVTDVSAKSLTVDYTLEHLYDCRNEDGKPGFYYFDSRYQPDLASGDSVPDKRIVRVTYDRASRKALALNKANASYTHRYSYSKTYIAFGVRQVGTYTHPAAPTRDTLDLGKLLAPVSEDLLSGWRKDGTVLSIPRMRVIDASFPLPPNTEFTCKRLDDETSKETVVHKRLFIPCPTEYEVGKRTVLLLTPGDSITQEESGFTGRGSEKNNLKYDDFRRFFANRYDEFDISFPDQFKKAFQLRDSVFQSALQDISGKIDPYWLHVFRQSESYLKAMLVLHNYTKWANDKEAWHKSGLLDWQAPYFTSVNPIIDYAYSFQKYDAFFYNTFIDSYAAYKKTELRSDNLNPGNRREERTPQEDYLLNKQILSGFPQYIANAFNLMDMMNDRALSEIERDYNDFITSCPDARLTGPLKNRYDKLLLFEPGNNIRETGLMIADSLPLVKGSDRKYILLFLSTGGGLSPKNLQDARDLEKLLKTEGLDSGVKLELYARFARFNALVVKPYKPIPEKQLQDLNQDLGMFYLAILMREDGTILHRQSSLADQKTILDIIREDKNRAGDNGWMDFIYGSVSAFLLAIGIHYLYRRRVKAKEKQEQIRCQIRELELRAIRSQMNPHFIFNALSSIQNLINRPANKEAGEYLVNFSRLLRKVLSTSEKKLVPLSDEIEQIELYLKLEQLRFPFSYSLVVGENIEPELIEIPGMLIQPFVENAVKHGIAPRGTGEIMIRLSSPDQLLVIDIIDDGPGIQARDPHEGFGIRAISNQFELLKTVYNTEIDIKITNRQDEEASATGCHIRLSIPL